MIQKVNSVSAIKIKR